MDCKQQRQLATLTTHLAQELLTDSAGVDQEVLQRRRAMKTRSPVGGERRLAQPTERVSEATALQLHKKSRKNSVSAFLWWFGTWNRLESWKSSISGCLMSWLQTKANHFSILCDSDARWKVDFTPLATTSSVAGLRKSCRALPRPDLAQKSSWALFGGLLLAWPTTAFWILVKPFHLRSTLSKSVRCTENCNAWGRNWFRFPPRQHSLHVTQPSLQKLNKMAHNLASSEIFIRTLTNRLPLLQASRPLFAGKTVSQPSGGRKCFPRVHGIPKHRFFFFIYFY